MINTFDTKILLHNYILYSGDASYVGIFPVDLGMSLIFTDFQQYSYDYLLLVLIVVEIPAVNLRLR